MGVAEEYCFAPVNYMAGQATAPVEVSILNGRTVDGLDWHKHGFQLIVPVFRRYLFQSAHDHPPRAPYGC